MKTLKDITAEPDTIRALVLADADGELTYITGIANHGCSGGSCSGLIYYADTHAFTAKYMTEINEMLEDFHDSSGINLLAEADTHGDLFNFLAWWAYECCAQEIASELEADND